MEHPDRIKLKVLGLSYSQIQTDAYALILAEINGPRHIPVVIGAAEAQSIALRMESITPARPMTHDLFVSFAHAFGVKLQSVFIYKFEDGIFSSELTFSDGERTIAIDSRTSDAVAIAMRTGSPIYTTPEIIEQTGFIMQADEREQENDDTPQSPGHFPENDNPDTEAEIDGEQEEIPYGSQPRMENFTVEQLQQTLEQLIANEDYEQAAKVSEILNRKLNKK